MRPLFLLLCLTLAGCSSSEEFTTVAPYVTPSLPTLYAANKGVAQAISEEQIKGPLEISDPRETDHGPGRFVLCLRGVEPKYNRNSTYAVFFDNDDYKGSRMSVMIDDCEKQAYRPFVAPLVPASATPSNAAPAPAQDHKRKHSSPT